MELIGFLYVDFFEDYVGIVCVVYLVVEFKVFDCVVIMIVNGKEIGYINYGICD